MRERDRFKQIRDVSDQETLTAARRAVAALAAALENPDSYAADLGAALDGAYSAVEGVAELLFDAEGMGDDVVSFAGYFQELDRLGLEPPRSN